MNRTYTYLAIALSLLFAAPRAAYADFFDSFPAPPGLGGGPPMPPGFAPPMPQGMPKPPGFDDLIPTLGGDPVSNWSSAHGGFSTTGKKSGTRLHFPGRTYDKGGSVPGYMGASKGGSGGGGGGSMPFNSTFDFGQSAGSYAPQRFTPPGAGAPPLPPGLGGSGLPGGSSMPAPPMPGMKFFENGPF
jgi:hypothetical protein